MIIQIVPQTNLIFLIDGVVPTYRRDDPVIIYPVQNLRLVRVGGIEPPTPSLSVTCPTTELHTQTLVLGSTDPGSRRSASLRGGARSTTELHHPRRRRVDLRIPSATGYCGLHSAPFPKNPCSPPAAVALLIFGSNFSKKLHQSTKKRLFCPLLLIFWGYGTLRSSFRAI